MGAESTARVSSSRKHRHALHTRQDRTVGVPLLGSIPIDPFVSNGSDSGVPVILGEGHAAESLNLIVDEVLAAVPKVNPIDCTAHGTLETWVTISNN